VKKKIAGAVAAMSTFCVAETSWLSSMGPGVGAADDDLDLVWPRRRRESI
jgi:hypothetical protein